MIRQTGRPALPGPRYACGRRKPDDRGEAAFNRLKHAPLTLKDLFDPHLGSALGRLSPDFMAELSWTQVEAGKAVARIYGAWHTLTGIPSRSAASPSYQRAVTRVSRETIGMSAFDLDARIKRAERRYSDLQEIIQALPISTAEQGRARAIIEDLCLDDRQPAAANLPSIRAILSRIALKLRIVERTGSEPAIAVTSKRPPRASPVKLAKTQRDKLAYFEVHRAIGWPEQVIEEGWERYQAARALLAAKRDREHFRRDKGAGREGTLAHTTDQA